MTGTRAVSRHVRSAFRAHALLVVAESLVVAASAGIATHAAAIAGSSAGGGAQRAGIALVVAALAGVAWGLERLGDPSSVARKLDRDRGLRGAVLTAFQAEALPEMSEVARLLGSRVAPELSARRFVGTAARSSAVLLALPCLAIALWSLAADASERARARPLPDLSAPTVVAAGFAGRAEALRSRADGIAANAALPPALEEESRRIAAGAAALGARRVPPAADPEGALRDLERRLELVQRAIPSDAVTRRDDGGTMAGPGSADESPADGTMRDEGSNARTGDAPGRTPPGADPAVGSGERGVLASRWWASRYDAVVDRWVEVRRQAPLTPPR